MLPAHPRCGFIVAAGLSLAVGVAVPVAAQSAQDHQYTSADIEAGSRIYANQCALCHGPQGDQVTGVNLRRGQFRRVSSDDDIRAVIAKGVAETGMPAFAFSSAELDALVAFIRAGFDTSGTAVKVGDAHRGRTLFAGKGGCASCHRVNGIGPRGAPDLSDIGAVRSAPALQRAMLDPTAAMWPINRPVRVVTRDGQTIRGRRLNEDTFTVQVLDEERERLLSFVKADLREYEVGTASPMPSMAGKLTADEVADLVAYLLSLKGQ